MLFLVIIEISKDVILIWASLNGWLGFLISTVMWQVSWRLGTLEWPWWGQLILIFSFSNRLSQAGSHGDGKSCRENWNRRLNVSWNLDWDLAHQWLLPHSMNQSTSVIRLNLGLNRSPDSRGRDKYLYGYSFKFFYKRCKHRKA